MSILKIEPSAINTEANFSLGSLSVTGNINVGAATIAATESGDLAFTTANGTFDITANTVNFLNTVATTSIAPGESISTGGGTGTGEKFVSLVQDGTLRVVNGISRWYPPVTVTVKKIIARVDQAPVGAGLNIRINKVSGTTTTIVMSIAAGALKAENNTPSMTLAPDDYLTVDITRIGASVAGRSLRVTFVYE